MFNWQSEKPFQPMQVEGIEETIPFGLHIQKIILLLEGYFPNALITHIILPISVEYHRKPGENAQNQKQQLLRESAVLTKKINNKI